MRLNDIMLRMKRGPAGLRRRSEGEVDRRAGLDAPKLYRHTLLIEPYLPFVWLRAGSNVEMMRRRGCSVESYPTHFATGDLNIVNLTGLGRYHDASAQALERPGIGRCNVSRRDGRSRWRGNDKTVASYLAADVGLLPIPSGDAIKRNQPHTAPYLAVIGIFSIDDDAHYSDGDAQLRVDAGNAIAVVDDGRIGPNVAIERVLDRIGIGQRGPVRRAGQRQSAKECNANKK